MVELVSWVLGRDSMRLTLLVRNFGKVVALSVPSCEAPVSYQLKDIGQDYGQMKPFVSFCDRLATSVVGLTKESKVKA